MNQILPSSMTAFGFAFDNNFHFLKDLCILHNGFAQWMQWICTMCILLTGNCKTWRIVEQIFSLSKSKWAAHRGPMRGGVKFRPKICWNWHQAMALYSYGGGQTISCPLLLLKKLCWFKGHKFHNFTSINATIWKIIVAAPSRWWNLV